MPGARLLKFLLVAAALLLAGCAAEPQAKLGKLAGRVWDPKLGVWSSPQMVADGDPVPRGGGSYLTGHPYVIGGRTYVPSQNAAGYVAVGTASWYGDAFHGRRTANGEVFDKRSISAAHPTLPLPSYVRVTNTGNGRSMIVRVNDRGPYHGGRVMDVSQRVAEALSFRGAGTARIKVEYVGKAPLAGSDDEVLMASLRTDGGAAEMPGMPSTPATMVADASDDDRAPPAPSRTPLAATRPAEPEAQADEDAPAPATVLRRSAVPVPPARPFAVGPMPDLGAGPDPRRERRRAVPRSTAMVLPPVAPRSPLLRHAASPTLRRQAMLGSGRDTAD